MTSWMMSIHPSCYSLDLGNLRLGLEDFPRVGKDSSSSQAQVHRQNRVKDKLS